MKLTLLMPGLAWLDVHDGAEVCRGLSLPALSCLLGRGHRHGQALSLTELYGWAGGFPLHGLARELAKHAGLTGDDWLMADPVHVRIDRDRALLADVGVMRLSQDEADAMVQSLNRHFAEDGLTFHAIEPGRWLLQLPGPSQAQFTPLQDAVGENVNEHLPAGERGLHWSRLLNEMQMLLYTHPVNDAREMQGELAVNSVWLWGDGAAASQLADQPQADLLLSDDPILQQQADCPTDAMPYDFSGLMARCATLQANSHVVVVQDALLSAAQYRDAWGWREQLQRMETDWFQPLLQALKQGKISELQLQCHGDAGFKLRIYRRDLWKFWQRPQSPATLY